MLPIPEFDSEGWVIPPCPLYDDDGEELTLISAKQVWWLSMSQVQWDRAQLFWAERERAQLAEAKRLSASTAGREPGAKAPDASDVDMIEAEQVGDAPTLKLGNE